MVIRFQKAPVIFCAGIFLALGLVGFFLSKTPGTAAFLGGTLVQAAQTPPRAAPQNAGDAWEERFVRPSQRAPLPNPYSYSSLSGKPVPVFSNPEDVIYAYYGVLEQASNMLGFTGGCGTIGEAALPYPYAYQFLSANRQSQLNQEQFIQSFRGTGHITLLTLEPADGPPNSQGQPARYYMVELETIRGFPEGCRDQSHASCTYFEYDYGLIRVVQEGKDWKIDEIRYFCEDFLCAPYHGWQYDAEAVVQIVYMENMKLVDQVCHVEQKGTQILITAAGKEGCYQLEFVRLTNGVDLLLRESVQKEGQWIPSDLLQPPWRWLKFSAAAM